MALKTSTGMTNGSGARKCRSWIESFVAHHDNLDSPIIFRKWAAIGVVAAVLEQKVWLMTSSRLHPNLYTFLVGHPGVGKTRTVRAARAYAAELADFHFAPTSVSGASLVDSLLGAKRSIVCLPDPPKEYNSIMIAADELGAFMHKYDDEMVGILSAFYDPDPYGQRRRGGDLKISIKSPQVNILAGTTPSNLMKFMPEGAWDQGFTSRIILIFSDERIVGDDFNTENKPLSKELIYDLGIINSLAGKYTVTEDYRSAVNNWRSLGEPPAPNHPKLIHYNTRRRVHLYKLSMVAAAATSNKLTLTKADFNTAMGWLLEAEGNMPEVFKAGAVGADGKAMEEIYHWLAALGKPTPEHQLLRRIQELVPIHSVTRVLEVMERSGQIRATHLDKKTGQRFWSALPPAA